jgi:hypothetical protein
LDFDTLARHGEFAFDRLQPRTGPSADAKGLARVSNPFSESSDAYCVNRFWKSPLDGH